MLTLCEACRRVISKGTRRGMRQARRAGVRMGRPLEPIADRDLARVRSGELTIAELSRKLGIAPVTIRRRLRSGP